VVDNQKYNNILANYVDEAPHKAMSVCLSSLQTNSSFSELSGAKASEDAVSTCAKTCKDCQLLFVDFDQVYDLKSHLCKKDYNTGMAVGVASLAAIGVMSAISGSAPDLSSVQPPPDSSYCNTPTPATSGSSAEQGEELEEESVCMAYATRTSMLALAQAQQVRASANPTQEMQTRLKQFAQEGVNKGKLSEEQVRKISAVVLIAYANPNIGLDTMRDAVYKSCKKDIKKQNGVYVE
jgi:hypothetical protein